MNFQHKMDLIQLNNIFQSYIEGRKQEQEIKAKVDDIIELKNDITNKLKTLDEKLSELSSHISKEDELHKAIDNKIHEVLLNKKKNCTEESRPQIDKEINELMSAATGYQVGYCGYKTGDFDVPHPAFS